MSSNPATNDAQPGTTVGQTVEEALAAIDSARVVNFQIGRTFITPGAQDALLALGLNPADFLDRHRRGEWGDLSEHDRQLNDEAVKDGSRIFSSYKVEGLEDGKVWVITEAADDDGARAATTILLPSEY